MKKEYILKVGLAFTLLYAGISSFLRPEDWVGFVPTWVNHLGVSREFALMGHASLEILLAILLLTGWQKRIIASLISLDVLAIILVNGFNRSVFPITFRDVGLLAVAVYFALPEEK